MYLLSMLLFLIVCIAYTVITLDGRIEIIIDVPSLVLLMLIMIPAIISSGLLKDFNNAFQLSIRKKAKAGKVELMRAVEAVSLMIKMLGATGIFLTLLQFAICFYRIREKALGGGEGLVQLVAYFIVSAIPMIYAAVFVIFLLPMRARLSVQLNELLYSEMGCREKDASAVSADSATYSPLTQDMEGSPCNAKEADYEEHIDAK